MPATRGGFLRKSARMDKKKKLSDDLSVTESEISDIINEAKVVFDDYSVVVAAFVIRSTLNDILSANDRADANEIRQYIKDKKERVDGYLNEVVRAMRKEL